MYLGDWEAANRLLVRLQDSSNLESCDGEREGRSQRKKKRLNMLPCWWCHLI